MCDRNPTCASKKRYCQYEIKKSVISERRNKPQGWYRYRGEAADDHQTLTECSPYRCPAKQQDERDKRNQNNENGEHQAAVASL
jgi:hypothetical protein